jgi:hypothetical protein
LLIFERRQPSFWKFLLSKILQVFQ